MRRDPLALVLGTVLILVGAVFLLDQAGVAVIRHLWKAWPLVPVGLGIALLWRVRRGLPARLSPPERVLLVLVTLGGLIATSVGVDGSGRPRAYRPPRPRPAPHPPAPPGWEEAAPAVDWDAVGSTSAELSARGRLVLSGSGTELVVTPAGGSRRLVTASLESSPRLGEALPLRFETRDDELHLGVHAPARPGGPRFRLRVTAPSGTDLEIRHDGGPIRLVAMGTLTLVAGSADVGLEAMQGAGAVQSSFGRLSARGCRGPLAVRTRFGDVEIEGHVGDVTVEASDGEIALRGVEGRVEVQAPRASIRLEAVRGDVEVRSAGGSVEATSLSGALRVTGPGVRTRAALVAGRVELSTSDGHVRIERAGGGVFGEVEDGDVEVIEGGGPIELVTRRGDLRIVETRAEVAVKAFDGDVWAELTGAPLRIDADRGDVTLQMRGAPANLEVRASDGLILAPASSSLRRRSGATGAELASIVHDGGPSVVVLARHGTIQLVD